MTQQLDRARLLVNYGRYDDAQKEIHQYLTNEPNDGEAHTLLAIIFLNLKKTDDAKAAIEAATSFAPNEAYNFYVFSKVWFQKENITEAEQLAGASITSEADMRHAAARIREMGARAVLLKGGHLTRQRAEGNTQKAGTEEAIDLLDDEGTITVFRGEFVRGVELHGSGCILSSAIAAGLGKGLTLEDSVDAAKKFVLKVIQTSPRVGG